MQPPRKRTIEMGFQLAPMIDMTFLLLIFFMVTQKITNQQKLLEIKLPIASAAVLPDDLSGRDIVNLDGEGRIYAGERPVDLPGLKTYLKRRLDEVPPLRIYVRADAGTNAGAIKSVMKACAEAGAIEVIFATHKK